MIAGREVRVGIVAENHYPHLGGMELVNHFLSRSLHALPNTAACVASCASGKPVACPYPLYRARSLSILTAHFRRTNIEQMVRRERVNVLHGSMLHGGGARAVEAAKRFGLPVVVAAHGSDVQVVPEARYGARLDPAVEQRIRDVLERADRIVAPSTLTRDALLELGADPWKVTVVPNGVAFDEIGAIPHEDARRRLGLRRDDFVVITVGRNRPVKRLALLFEAVALARREVASLRIVSVGPPEDLAALARRYGIEDACVRTGPIPRAPDACAPPFAELVHLYRAADLYASVSYVESFGAAALEALACGTPVLVGRAHGVRDVLRVEETGFVLDPETPEALAERLVAIAARRAELAACREEIRASVASLAWPHIAARLRELYAAHLS